MCVIIGRAVGNSRLAPFHSMSRYCTMTLNRANNPAPTLPVALGDAEAEAVAVAVAVSARLYIK
jgi:hypothetical protein